MFQEAVDCLLNGGILIYPTETVYGIGAHYANEAALKKLFTLKKRDESKPVLLLIPDIDFLKTTTAEISPHALLLAQHFWPGPLTLLMHACPALSTLLTGADKKVGLRISSSPFVQKLMVLFKDGITSTSANISGGKNPSRIADIPEALINAVDLVIDGGPTPGEYPSTVFDVSEKPFKLMREGVIRLDSIMQVLES
jgi:L-threonylcarbamoyladenylate synthase